MKLITPLPLLLIGISAYAQTGAPNGEWRFYGGDAGGTRYSALSQIHAGNVKDLSIAWRWKAQNFGRRPDINWEVTPLIANGVLYFTAGTRRDTVAVDGATGETLWMYRLDEGVRRPRPSASTIAASPGGATAMATTASSSSRPAIN